MGILITDVSPCISVASFGIANMKGIEYCISTIIVHIYQTHNCKEHWMDESVKLIF